MNWNGIWKIVGRWKCLVCKEFSLCSQCYIDQELNQNFLATKHIPSHKMIFESVAVEEDKASKTRTETLDEETVS